MITDVKNSPTVLVVTKDVASRGGVANYFNLFFSKFSEKNIRLERFDIGSRSKDYYTRRKRCLGYCLDYALDVARFISLIIIRNDIKIIHLNPSLIPVPLFRDGILLLLSKLLRRKVLVFIRGWRDDIARSIGDSLWRRLLFTNVFRRADCIIVLAEDFCEQIVGLGIDRSRIVVSKTMFDGDMVKKKHGQITTEAQFLFLSRISREKGAFDIVEAAGRVKKRGLHFKIVFCGHGATTDTVTELKVRAECLGIQDSIEWRGFVDGPAKYDAYAKADVYLLPSYHEGCPNSLLEAMGGGCYVLCTTAGAMKEIVEDGKNGRIVKTADIADLAENMSWVITNIDEVRRSGIRNIEHAFKRFESKVIVDDITSVYARLIEEKR